MRLNSSGMNKGEGRGRDEDAADAEGEEGEGDVDERAVDEEEGMIWYISHLSFCFAFCRSCRGEEEGAAFCLKGEKRGGMVGRGGVQAAWIKRVKMNGRRRGLVFLRMRTCVERRTIKWKRGERGRACVVVDVVCIQVSGKVVSIHVKTRPKKEQ